MNDETRTESRESRCVAGNFPEFDHAKIDVVLSERPRYHVFIQARLTFDRGNKRRKQFVASVSETPVGTKRGKVGR